MALFLATGMAFGFAIWSDYLRVVLPVQTAIMNVDGGVAPAMMPTIFIGARMIGVPVAAAYAAQSAVSLAALAAVVWAYAKPRDPILSQALLVTTAILATPYAFSYDMVVFAWVIVRLRRCADESQWDAALNVAVWLLPIAMIRSACAIFLRRRWSCWPLRGVLFGGLETGGASFPASQKPAGNHVFPCRRVTIYRLRRRRLPGSAHGSELRARHSNPQGPRKIRHFGRFCV